MMYKRERELFSEQVAHYTSQLVTTNALFGAPNKKSQHLHPVHLCTQRHTGFSEAAVHRLQWSWHRHMRWAPIITIGQTLSTSPP